MRVLAIVQAWNREDPIRGFVVRWIEKLAERVDEVVVLTLELQHPATHLNIKLYSLGKEYMQGRGKRLRYLVWWHRHMREIIRICPPDIVFTHMSPIFSVLVAPYVKPKSTPIVTWYAHRQVTTTLRFAHQLSNRMVASAETSYRYKHDKLVVVGQGIDTELFSPDGAEPAPPLSILSVGRLAPIKDPMTLIESIYLLRQRGHDLHCTLIGDASGHDQSYARAVRRRVQELGLEGLVLFPGAVPNDQVVHWYRRCSAHVNGSPPDHSLDKAALEAMACAKPSLSSTVGFRSTLGRWADCLLFRHGDPEDLAEKIGRLLKLDPGQRQAMGKELRHSVLEKHSLEGLADRLVELFEQLCHRQFLTSE